jgi:hypothetical protein
MLTPRFVPHKRKLDPSIPQVAVDTLPVRKVKCDSPEHLLQSEGRERFDDAFRRFAAEEAIYDGVEGNTAPGKIISALALFDVFCHLPPLSIV